MTTYARTSLYSLTPISGNFLGYYVHRSVPADPTDSLMFCTSRWENRPDLMALDVYGNEDYAMAIPLRNGLRDPVFDLVMGRALAVPTLARVQGIFG